MFNSKKVYHNFIRRLSILKWQNSSPLKLIGVTNKEFNRLSLSKLPTDKSNLFGHCIKITSAFWYLHSLNEIFIEEVYKFETNNDRPVIIDCGANIGLSIIHFKKKFPNSRIIAFEPDKVIFDYLIENLNSFNFKNVTLENKAVWTENGQMNFLSHGNLGGQLKLNNDNKNNSSESLIQTVRLSDYLDSEIDFLKIDIEGAEVDIIKDCADKLCNVKKIFVEYHSSPDQEQKLDLLLRILTSNGFKYYIKEAWNNLPYPYLRYNYNPHFDLQLNIFGYR